MLYNAGSGTPEPHDSCPDDPGLVFTHSDYVCSIAFTPVRQQLAPDTAARVFATACRGDIRALPAASCGSSALLLHTHTVDDIRVSLDLCQDGTLLASGSDDNRVCLTSLASRTVLKEWQLDDYVLCVAFSPCGHVLATSCRNGLVSRAALSPNCSPRASQYLWRYALHTAASRQHAGAIDEIASE